MRSRIVQGVTVPAFLYGTAWKEERTEALTRGRAGRGLSRHRYRQPAPALRGSGGRQRGESRDRRGSLRSRRRCSCKPSSRTARDRTTGSPTIPRPTRRCRSSSRSRARSSHLHTDYLDSYVLHGPSTRRGIAAEDWSVWRAMEALHAPRRVRLMGVSNVSLEQLVLLHREAAVKPSFVQNRCYASSGLGSRRASVLQRARRRLPGFLAAHGQPRGRERSGREAHRAAHRPLTGAGRVPLRASRSA